ncbi:hypothetical protein ASE12_12760 [Aeromicrobium sp. Root236]|uniref:hypothetical protein n=1 Tax=Aeromicrobium sp. Root236 TaxID=1736498 RepID=UPI0006FCE93D|nr:hypothetical protein [Aeromicrobium sp. Root236]KRC65547.1 hypothetical protein ASE12_12760 [Aeromicrobium sp. Root236]
MALWIVAGLSLIGTLVCGAIGGYELSTSHHMASVGVTTTAVVTEVDGDDVTLTFTTDSGRRVTTEVFWMPLEVPEVDSEVPVTYDPEDVTHVLPEGSNEDQVIGIVLLVMAGLGLAVSAATAIGAVFVHRARTRNAKAVPRPY